MCVWDRPRDKSFSNTCCQSVSFAPYVRRHWLGFFLVQRRSCLRTHGRVGRAAPFLPKRPSSGRLLMDSRRASRTARAPSERGDQRRLRASRDHPTASLKNSGNGQCEVSGDREQGQDRVSSVEVTEGTGHDGWQIEGIAAASEQPAGVGAPAHRRSGLSRASSKPQRKRALHAVTIAVAAPLAFDRASDTTLEP
jgi:hypothetical protein